jgi:hypothetical protein
VQRLVGDLGDGVPHRHLDGADADRALGMPAGLLVLQHDGEDFLRREIVAGVIKQRIGRRLEDARDKPRPHLRAAGIASGGIEGETANWLAGALNVGDDGDHRRRHLAEIDARIGERRIERDRGLADINDAHFFGPVLAGQKARSAVFAPEVPAISIRLVMPWHPNRDARVKPAHDKG